MMESSCDPKSTNNYQEYNGQPNDDSTYHVVGSSVGTMIDEQQYATLTPVDPTVNSKTSPNTTTSVNILDESIKQLFQDDDDNNGETARTVDGTSATQYVVVEDSQGHHHGDEEGYDDDYYGSMSRSSIGSENSQTPSTNSNKVDPFDPACRIPLPGQFERTYLDNRTFVRRRNERERARVRSVNDGFERLRSHLPLNAESRDRRLSKVETLRFAIQYIQHLQSLREQSDENCGHEECLNR